MHLYDYAWAQIPAASMAGVPGCIGIMRYGNGTKALTPVERDNTFRVGLGIGLIHEANADDLDHPDRAAGLAQRANAEWDALGAPTSCPIFFCDDRNDPASAGIVAQSYDILRAASHRPAGLYGSSADLDTARPLYGWQVETWVPRKSYISGWAHLIQLANTKAPLIPGIPTSQYDTNILVKAFPLWGGAPVPPTTAQEDEMRLVAVHALDGSLGQVAVMDGAVFVEGPWDQPRGAFGVPQGYYDWASGDASRGVVAGVTPYAPVFLSPAAWKKVEARTAGGGGATVGVDAAALTAAVKSALAGTKFGGAID